MTTETIKLTLALDCEAAKPVIEQLRRELAALSELAAKGIQNGFELRSIHGNIETAPGAFENRVVLELTNEFVEFVAALAALNRKLRVLVGVPGDVSGDLHGESFHVN